MEKDNFILILTSIILDGTPNEAQDKHLIFYNKLPLKVGLYECVCMVINDKICCVPLNNMSSVYVIRSS